MVLKLGAPDGDSAGGPRRAAQLRAHAPASCSQPAACPARDRQAPVLPKNGSLLSFLNYHADVVATCSKKPALPRHRSDAIDNLQAEEAIRLSKKQDIGMEMHQKPPTPSSSAGRQQQRMPSLLSRIQRGKSDGRSLATPVGSYFTQRADARDTADSSQASTQSQGRQEASVESPQAKTTWLQRLQKKNAAPSATGLPSSQEESAPASRSPRKRRPEAAAAQPSRKRLRPMVSEQRKQCASDGAGDSAAQASTRATDVVGAAVEAPKSPSPQPVRRRIRRVQSLQGQSSEASSSAAPTTSAASVGHSQPAPSAVSDRPGRNAVPVRSLLRDSNRPRPSSKKALPHIKWKKGVTATYIENFRSEGSKLWYDEMLVECDRCGHRIEWGFEGQQTSEGNAGGSRFTKDQALCDSCLCRNYYADVGALYLIILAAQDRHDAHGDNAVKTCVGQVLHYMSKLLTVCDRATRDMLITMLGKQNEPESYRTAFLRSILEKAMRRMEECAASPHMPHMNTVASSSRSSSSASPRRSSTLRRPAASTSSGMKRPAVKATAKAKAKAKVKAKAKAMLKRPAGSWC